MRKIAWILFVIVLFNQSIICTADAGNTVLNMVVDENDVINQTTEKLFGMNNEWRYTSSVFLDANNNVNPKLKENLDEYPFVVSRMAGSSANKMKWKNAIGPIGQRPEYGLSPYTGPGVQGLGPIEWVNAITSVNENANFTYVINMYDEISYIKDLIEFLVGEGDVDNNGVDWSQVRKDCGIEDPVNIIIWELGNELDIFDDENPWDINRYINKCREVITAIRTIDTKGKIAAHTATQPLGYSTYYNNYKYWHQTVLQELGPDIDYLSYHDYYNFNNENIRAERAIMRLTQDIENTAGCGHIKIFMSEHATGRYVYDPRYISTGSNNSALWYTNIGLGSAISEATFFNRMMRHPRLEVACWHGLSVGPWYLCYTENNEHKPTAVFDLIKLYYDNGIGDVVKVNLDGYLDNQDCLYTASAVKVDGGINLFFSNWDETQDYDINVNLKGKYKIKSKTIMTGNELYSCNDVGKSEVSIITQEYDSNELFTGVTLPKRSVMVVKLEEQSEVVVDVATFAGKTALVITGELPGGYNGSKVMLMLREKNNAENIGYIDQTIVDRNGRYSFGFNFKDNIENYEIKLNLNNQLLDVTNSINQINQISDLFVFDVDQLISEDFVSTVVNIENIFNLANVNYTICIAAYSWDDKLLNISIFSDNEIALENHSENFESAIVEGANKIKVFIWNNLLNMLPMHSQG